MVGLRFEGYGQGNCHQSCLISVVPGARCSRTIPPASTPIALAAARGPPFGWCIVVAEVLVISGGHPFFLQLELFSPPFLGAELGSPAFPLNNPMPQLLPAKLTKNLCVRLVCGSVRLAPR